MIKGVDALDKVNVLDKIAGGSFITDEIDYQKVFIPEEFSEEQRMISKMIEEFVSKEIASLGEAAQELNYELTLHIIKKAGEVGILGACLPEQYGGLGLDGVRFALIKEKLNTGSFSITAAIGGQIGIGMLPIVFFGTEEQRKKYLPDLESGKKTTSFALTEPASGSDASSIKTTAKLAEDGKCYVLNGSKVFITNAGFADMFIVFVKINGTDFSAFIVERDTEGITIGPEEQKMGLKASSTCSLTFEDVKVPVENLIGKAGQGHLFAFNVLNFGRLGVGAACLGNTKDALECSVKYANVRIQFGRQISAFPLIGKKLAEMNIKTFVLESMVYRTADIFDKGLKELDFSDPDLGNKSRKAIGEYMLECSIIKVFGSEAIGFTADEGLQIHGGYGYMKDYPIEEIYRDARIKRIFEGTNEINRLFLTSTILKRLAKGQFDQLQKAFERIPVELEHSNFNQSFEGTLEQEEYLVAMAKKIYPFTLAQALQKHATKLDHEQEICSDLGDIIINIYAMESALLRTKKLSALNGENMTRNAINMTVAYIHEAFDQIVRFSKEVLYTLKTGDELLNQLAILDELSRKVPINTLALKREIATKVIEAEKYVVG